MVDNIGNVVHRVEVTVRIGRPFKSIYDRCPGHIDNGRRKILAGDLADSLLCIRCGACLNVCPVFAAIGGHAYDSAYPGPIGSVVSPGLFGQESYGHLAKASTLCGACFDTCPVAIDLPALLLKSRSEYSPHYAKSTGLAMKLYAWLARNPQHFRAALRLAKITTAVLPGKEGWLHALPISWSRSRAFPRFASARASQRWRTRIPQPSTSEPVRNQTVSVKADPSPPLPEIFAQWTTALEAVGGEWIECKSSELPEIIAGVFAARGVSEWIAGDLNEALITEVSKVLEKRSIARLAVDDSLSRLSQAQAGITMAIAGIAETGTIVVPSAPGRPALPSLLPPLHVAILHKDTIIRDLESWLGSNAETVVTASSQCTLITGPSRTADVEMTLSIGVHGPRELVVLCIS